MFDREFEDEVQPTTGGFRCTLRLSPQAYRKLRELEVNLVTEYKLRPEEVSRSRIVSQAITLLDLETLAQKFLQG